MILYSLICRTGPSSAIGFVLLEAGSGLWPFSFFLFDDNVDDGDDDGDDAGHCGDDDGDSFS